MYIVLTCTCMVRLHPVPVQNGITLYLYGVTLYLYNVILYLYSITLYLYRTALPCTCTVQRYPVQYGVTLYMYSTALPCTCTVLSCTCTVPVSVQYLYSPATNPAVCTQHMMFNALKLYTL